MSTQIKILALIIFSVFLSRLWVLLNSPYTFYSDDAIYAFLAKSWVEGQWQYVFHPTWPPLYPVISAIFSVLIPGFENALRLVSLVFGSAIVIPLFFLLRQTTSFAQAASYTLAITLFTPLLAMSLLPLSDSLAVFLIISGLVTVFFALVHLPARRGVRLLFLSSFIFGLVYLTRTEGTMFFFLTAVYLLVFAIFKCRTKQFALTILSFAAVFFLTISPYAIATSIQTGEWSLSQKFSAQVQQGHMFAINKKGTTWAQEIDSAKSPNYRSLYYKNGLNVLVDKLVYFMRSFPEKLSRWQVVFKSVFPVWALPLVLVGLICLHNKKIQWPLAYLFFIVVTAVPLTVFITPSQDTRYLAWTIPLFLYFFYVGVGKIIPKSKVAAGLAFLAVFIFPGASIDNVLNPGTIATDFSNSYNRSELRMAGDWIKNHTLNPNPRVMMRHEGVEFYSGGETVYTPMLPYNEALEYARINNVDFIIAWDEELLSDEKLRILLDGEVAHPGLQKVYSTKGRNGIIVYSTSGKL